jgi:hypothetical protein
MALLAASFLCVVVAGLVEHKGDGARLLHDRRRSEGVGISDRVIAHRFE